MNITEAKELVYGAFRNNPKFKSLEDGKIDKITDQIVEHLEDFQMGKEETEINEYDLAELFTDVDPADWK